MKLKPLGDNILIEPSKKEKGKTDAGIYLPETVSKEGPEEGKVVEVGPGRVNDDGKKIPPSVKKGDTVIYNKSYGSQTIKVEGKEYLLLREHDVLAIVE